MATKTEDQQQTNTDEGWETINVGLGREWDLEHEGALIGIFVGSGTREVEDKQNGGTRETAYYQFDVGGDTRFLWGSYQLDEGMQKFAFGDMARITYLGTDSFNGAKGPQQVKNYRFERKPAAN